jgi:hypothetical protein
MNLMSFKLVNGVAGVGDGLNQHIAGRQPEPLAEVLAAMIAFLRIHPNRLH